jgi:hypothetical protein
MAWLQYAATAISAVSSLKQGNAANQQMQQQALQDEADANSAQAQSQEAAANERKRAKIVRSRALSVAGASGAGVSDPTVVDILSGIDTEGEVRALNALYEGDTQAAGLRSAAQIHRNMGKASKTAGYLDSASSIAGGIGKFAQNNPSFFAKYG